MSSTDAKTKEKFKLVSQDLTTFDMNPLFLKLTPNTLKLKIGNDDDAFSYITFIILNPGHQFFSYFHLDDKWNTFPLKWYIIHEPIPLAKDLFYLYKQGQDISGYF